MTGDLTFTTFGFLQLIPPPDRLVVRQRTEVHGKLSHEVRAAHLVDVFAGDGQRRRGAVSGHVQQPHKLLMELGIETLFNSMAFPGVVDASELEGAPRVRGASLRQEVLVGDRQALCANQGNA